MSPAAYLPPVPGPWRRSAYPRQRLWYGIGSTLIGGQAAGTLVAGFMHLITPPPPWWAFVPSIVIVLGYLYVLVTTRCWSKLWHTTGATAVIAKIYGKVGVFLLIVYLAFSIIGLFAAFGMVRAASQREQVIYRDNPW